MHLDNIWNICSKYVFEKDFETVFFRENIFKSCKCGLEFFIVLRTGNFIMFCLTIYRK